MTNTESLARDAQGYNGWSNYPTWAVALWMTNTEATYYLSRELAENARRSETPRVALADALREWLRDRNEPTVACLQTDLLGYAFDLVDWYEVADALLDEIPDEG